MKTLFLTAALLISGATSAAGITVSHPYSHPTPAPGVPGVGFITLTNTGKKLDRLLAVESPDAESIEIHSSAIKDGVMQMRALPKGVALPAGKSLTLGHGGLHLMLFGLKAPLAVGGSVPIRLKFARAAAISTALAVEPRPSDGSAAPVDHSQHEH